MPAAAVASWPSTPASPAAASLSRCHATRRRRRRRRRRLEIKICRRRRRRSTCSRCRMKGWRSACQPSGAWAGGDAASRQPGEPKRILECKLSHSEKKTNITGGRHNFCCMTDARTRTTVRSPRYTSSPSSQRRRARRTQPQSGLGGLQRKRKPRTARPSLGDTLVCQYRHTNHETGNEETAASSALSRASSPKNGNGLPGTLAAQYASGSGLVLAPNSTRRKPSRTAAR
mmetsp:Transcript_37536/g.124363  ORF Transcript_37536/g.124363 Transcript_37536/m.124363 type:complete len:230 (-) Transcript_37536:477-1166(-)